MIINGSRKENVRLQIADMQKPQSANLDLIDQNQVHLPFSGN